MADRPRVITRMEQDQQGLLRQRISSYVPALQGATLPAIRSVPAIADPYAGSMPQPVQMTANYVATPITRAQALVMKVHQVTIFLCILTAAAMLMSGWFASLWFIAWWLAFGSIEWVGVFVFLSVIDYRETPAAQNRHLMDAYIRMMEREQVNRLQAMYGDDFVL